jgi:predicted outer membrane repeat protein
MRALLLLSLALAIGCGDKNDDTGGPPDADADGYDVSEDCDDTDPDIHPGADERCNGVDDDCDGEIDEEGAVGSDTFYADVDGDGYGDEFNTIEICDLPSGYVSAPYDCDDSRADVNPTADELCDGVDNDCDGDIDEDASDAPTWYADEDEDGYGDDDEALEACDQPDGYVDNDLDCDDDDAMRSPDVDEICDGSDNNCDGHIDEDSAIDALTWYGDRDGDGYGNPAVTTTACDQPSEHVENGDDCQDNDANIHPMADELCDLVDNDCDGDTDEAGAIDAPTWYADVDGDGFGDPDNATAACIQPSGHVSTDLDCDDADADINPRATEICDGVDNDCDGDVDASNLVTLDGVANFGSIDAAVSAAARGGTVVVCDGTYTENVQIDDDLTLQSLNGSGSTTIDGDGASSCIAVSGGTVSISGFTLTDGAGDAHPINPSYTVGGGLLILATDPVTLDDMVFLANEADYGAGLFGNNGCNLTVTDSTFDLNNSDNSGGAAYLWDCTASFDTVVFEDNYAEWGGALFVTEGSLELEQCTIEDNYAAVDGGGIYAGDEVSITASTDTLLTTNEAGEWGGGVMMNTGVAWSGGELYDNDADYGAGFFAYTDGSADNEISGLWCEANRAGTSGGCGYAYGDLSIAASDIVDNGGYWGGGLFLELSSTYLVNSVMEENVVNYNGGGVYIYDDSELWSVSSDWGTGSTDNDPDDIYVDGGSNAYNGYGSSESFSCSDILGTCN